MSAHGHIAPRVSIVVPAYNRERYLGATLDSVLAQTVHSWELVVFDDGSIDGTVDVAKRYAAADPRIRVVQGPNGGVAAARNRGFTATTRQTEFVVFLDSDDLWEPDALETFIGVLDAHPEYSSVHSVVTCIDSEGRALPGDDLTERLRRREGVRDGRVVELGLHEPTTFADLAYDNWVLTPGAHLIRRKVAEVVGDFDVATDPADDWDLAIRVSRCGDIGFVDRPLLRWRRHSNTLTNTSPRWAQAHFRVRTKMLTDPTNTPTQTAAARLAFTGTFRSRWRQARQLLRDRLYAGAVREGARAARQYLLYVRAELALRLRRGHRHW